MIHLPPPIQSYTSATLDGLHGRMDRVTADPLDALLALADMMDFTLDEGNWHRPELIRAAVAALQARHG